MRWVPSGPGHRQGAPPSGAQPRAPPRGTCAGCPPAPGHRSGTPPSGAQPRAPPRSTCGGPPLAELHPQPSSTGRHSQSGGRADRVPAQGEARAGADDDGCRCAVQRFTFSTSTLSSRSFDQLGSDGARSGIFEQYVLGLWLAIANAVQFSVCSGVLRVLGLAQASPSGVASKGFLQPSLFRLRLGLAGIV